MIRCARSQLSFVYSAWRSPRAARTTIRPSTRGPRRPRSTSIAKEFAFASDATTVVDRLAEITIKNEGAESHNAALLKLADGKTVGDVQAFFGPNPPPGPPPFSVAGGVGIVGPGGTASVTQALPAGSYTFFCFVRGTDGVPHFAKGMAAPIVVTGNSTTSLPLPDGENASAAEFKFELPSLKAGTTVIRGKNIGQQDHEFQIGRVLDGKTADDALNWIKAPEGAPPLANIGGPIVGVGGSNSVKLKLVKGTYVFYCQIPDPTDNVPHVAKGMFQAVTIT